MSVIRSLGNLPPLLDGVIGSSKAGVRWSPSTQPPLSRRSFISLLAGAAGAGVIGWRVPERRIFLPARARVLILPAWEATLDPTPRPSHLLYIPTYVRFMGESDEKFRVRILSGAEFDQKFEPTPEEKAAAAEFFATIGN